MKSVSSLCVVLLCLGCIGCANAPGQPGPGPEVSRPEEVLEFTTLYKQNCAGCHGEDGKNGAAMSLANPVYLRAAGEATLRQITANGVPGKLMPAFETSKGGSLTVQQIDVLVQGMLRTWGRANDLSLVPSLAPTTKGNPANGHSAFTAFCARCHGVDGEGAKAPGSIVDPSYLALVSDQSLRSTIIAGRPDQGMPDWRSDMSGAGARAMSEQEITDIVEWLASQR